MQSYIETIVVSVYSTKQFVLQADYHSRYSILDKTNYLFLNASCVELTYNN